MSEPRMLPASAVLLLGVYGCRPGFIVFARECADAGFGLAQPGDDALSEERWDEVANHRVTALTLAFDRRSFDGQDL